MECIALNNEETKLELDRQNLLIRAESVADIVQRTDLRALIASSSPVVKKYKGQLSLLEAQIKREKDKNMLMTQKLASIQEELDVARDVVENKTRNKKTRIKKLLVSLCAIFVFGGMVGFVSALHFPRAIPYEKQMAVDADTTIPISITYKCSQLQAQPHQIEKKKVEKVKILSTKLNTYVYTGMVNSEGIPDGEGEAVFSNGDTFVGTFDNGELLFGRYTWVNDSSYFKGRFKDSEPDDQRGGYFDKNGKKL